jgi:hypothetical protein
VLKVEFSSDFEEFWDTDVDEFRPHAEVGDAERLNLTFTVRIAVSLDDPPVGLAKVVMQGAITAFLGSQYASSLALEAEAVSMRAM